MRVCWATTRWHVEGQEHHDSVLARGGPIITAFWHGRLFYSPFLAPPGRRTVAMISNNHDGELISAIVGRFKVASVRGSTHDPRKPTRDKGGNSGFTAALAELAADSVLAITPDGPRGPRMRAMPGVSTLAATAQAPVLPWAISTRRGRLARSWDRFLIPRPFDIGILIYGEPLPPPSANDPVAIEAHRAQVEASITRLTQEADRRMGRTPVDPG